MILDKELKVKKLKVFNQRVDEVSLEETFDLILKAIKEKKKSLFFALNLHILNLLSQDKEFKVQYEQLATCIFADGCSIVYLSKLKDRVSGTDLVEKILKRKDLKVFALGSSELVLKKIANQYSSTVVGFYSPPYQEKWDKKENQKIKRLIEKSKANILLVGVGPLKQEHWLVDNLSKLKGVYVGIGVGSAFNILSGETPRAPKIMKDYGFEWLWRIILEPRRLWKRYLSDLLFLFNLLFKKLIP